MDLIEFNPSEEVQELDLFCIVVGRLSVNEASRYPQDSEGLYNFEEVV